MDRYINAPMRDEDISVLRAGDYVYITGTVYTARNIIYYMGPSPAREGRAIGSAGPTTASRMDRYTPGFLDVGLKGMIGKGRRSTEVIDSIIKNKAVYFAAVGGAGALLSRSIISSKIIAYEDLGTEAIRELEVSNFPVIVVIDSKGNNLYDNIVRK